MDDDSPQVTGGSTAPLVGGVTLVSGDRMRPRTTDTGRSAFDDFYRTHRADALRWAVALVGDRAVAEELAQEALAAVGAKLRTIDNPAGYLRRTVVNRAASWHRSNARERRRLRRATAGQPTSYTSETSEMLDALSALTYRQRAAVTLRYWSDWTDDQIADALDCAPSTVRVLLHRGLTALEQHLREEDAR